MPPKGWRKNAQQQPDEFVPAVGSAPPPVIIVAGMKEEDVYEWGEGDRRWPPGTRMVVKSCLPLRFEYTRPDGSSGVLHTDADAFHKFNVQKVS